MAIYTKANEICDHVRSILYVLASVPGLPRYAVLLVSVRAGHTENGEGLG